MSRSKTTISDRGPDATDPRSGPVSCNTGGANPIDALGELLGYVEPAEPAPLPARASAFVFLTGACCLSYCNEGLRVRGDPSSGVIAPTVPAAHNPDPPPFENAHALAWGVDTLILGATMQIGPSILERLNELKAAGGTVKIASGPFRLNLESYGAAPHWRFILRGPAITVRIRARETYDHNMQIEVRSAFLWSVGVDGAVSLVRELLQRWALQDCGAIPELAGSVSERSVILDVSRIDLCADFGDQSQCGVLDGSELQAGRWITRARRRTCYTTADEIERRRVEDWHLDAVRARLAQTSTGHHDLARLRQDLVRILGGQPETRGEKITEHVRGALYWRGRTVTGYSFGAGAILARVYRKDIEIRASKKKWMAELWRARGYAGGPVWRIEFQLRSEGLKTFLEAGKTSRRWGDVRRRIDGLWAHLTARAPRGWLSLRDVGTDAKPERWPVSAFWLGVQGVRWGEATSLERITRGTIEREAAGARVVPRIRTRDEKIAAWNAASVVEHGTGHHAASQLGAQLAGVATAFAAAAQVRDQEHDPETDKEAKSRIMLAFRAELDARERDGVQLARAVSDAADRLVIRANWRRATS